MRRVASDASDASDDPVYASDASDVSHDPFDVSMQSFDIPGFTSESPAAAPAAHEFTWKLPKPPKPTVEEVDDDDDMNNNDQLNGEEDQEERQD